MQSDQQEFGTHPGTGENTMFKSTERVISSKFPTHYRTTTRPHMYIKGRDESERIPSSP